jgi:hypothetical protein
VVTISLLGASGIFVNELWHAVLLRQESRDISLSRGKLTDLNLANSLVRAIVKSYEHHVSLFGKFQV